MESKKIYEDSHAELVRIRKSMAMDVVSIDFTKLDGETKNMLMKSINDVLSKRIKDTEKVFLGVE